MKNYFFKIRSILGASVFLGFIMAPAMVCIHLLAAEHYHAKSICQADVKKETSLSTEIRDMKYSLIHILN